MKAKYPRWNVLLMVGLALAVLTLVACSDDDSQEAPQSPATEAGDQVSSGEGSEPGAETSEQTAHYPLTVVDASGAELTIEAEPQRVIALLSSVTTFLIDLGLSDRIIATDDFSLSAPELAGLPSVGGTNLAFNIEETVALEPDLIVAASGGTEEFIEQARTLGIPTVVLDFPADIAQVLDQLSFLGDIFGIPEQATVLVDDLRERLDRVAAAAAGAQPVRVYLELDQSTPTQPFSIGPGSLHQTIIELAGGENIFGDADSAFPQVNWESIIARDPAVIFLLDSTDFAVAGAFNPVSAEEVAARTGWDHITAVRSGWVVPLPPDMFSPGVGLVDALEQLADALEKARATSAHWAPGASGLVRAA